MCELILCNGGDVVSDHTCVTSYMNNLKHLANKTYFMPFEQTMDTVLVNADRKVYVLEI